MKKNLREDANIGERLLKIAEVVTGKPRGKGAEHRFATQVMGFNHSSTFVSMLKSSNPSHTKLLDILRVAPWLSESWLLTGNGDMYASCEVRFIKVIVPDKDANEEIVRNVEAEQKRLAAMSKMVDQLKKMYADKALELELTKSELERARQSNHRK